MCLTTGYVVDRGEATAEQTVRMVGSLGVRSYKRGRKVIQKGCKESE